MGYINPKYVGYIRGYIYVLKNSMLPEFSYVVSVSISYSKKSCHLFGVLPAPSNMGSF